MSCLRVNISAIPIQLSPTISLYCNVKHELPPLLVNEGYLFVEENGRGL